MSNKQGVAGGGVVCLSLWLLVGFQKLEICWIVNCNNL